MASSGVASSTISTAGTTKVSVIRCVSMSRKHAAGVEVPHDDPEWPPRRHARTAPTRVPPMWKSGMATSDTVSGPMWKTRSASLRMQEMFRPRDHGALGEAGGPRGVELGHHVLGAGFEARVLGGSGVAPASRHSANCSSGTHRRTQVTGGASSFDRGRVVGSEEEHRGAGVLDDGGHLGRGQTPVDRHADRAEEGAPEEDLEVLDAVAVEERHPVARAHARRRRVPAHPSWPVVHLGPREVTGPRVSMARRASAVAQVRTCRQAVRILAVRVDRSA